MIALLLLAAGCTKAAPSKPVIGTVTSDLRVDFGGKIGDCTFDNNPVAGDDVLISDEKAGACHAVPHK